MLYKEEEIYHCVKQECFLKISAKIPQEKNNHWVGLFGYKQQSFS